MARNRATRSRGCSSSVWACQVVVGRENHGLTFHSLRHTGASRMLEAGVDVKTVMLIGGWKNLKVLERYLYPSDAAKRADVDAIGRRRG